MNDKPWLPSALLVLLGLGLYLAPPGLLIDWRLGLHSLLLQASEPAADDPVDRAAPLPVDERIEELVDQLRRKDAEIESLKRRLRHLAEAREFLPELRFGLARVVGRGRGTLRHTVTLDLGHRDQLEPGSTVLQGQALAGVVARVGPRASLVQLLTSPGVLVDGRASATGELCAVTGDGERGARVIFYHPDVQARAGEMIVTSGLLGQAPPELLIGVLTGDPEEGAEPGTREAPLRLHANLTTLEDVLVVRPVATGTEGLSR